jgi:hypothetical protein
MIKNEFQQQWNVLEKVKVAWLKRPETTSVRDKIQSCECPCLAEGLGSMGDNTQGVGSVQGLAGVACSVGGVSLAAPSMVAQVGSNHGFGNDHT